MWRSVGAEAAELQKRVTDSMTLEAQAFWLRPADSATKPCVGMPRIFAAVQEGTREFVRSLFMSALPLPWRIIQP